jgi:hypothetical protein
MKERQQKRKERTIRVPKSLPLTISTADEIDINHPQNVDELIMVEVMKTGKGINGTVNLTTREVKITEIS